MVNPEEYLYELSKFVDSRSVLYINKDGLLRRIYCPFKVIVIVKVFTFEQGEIVLVEAVKVAITLEDVYIISGKAYLIQYFRLAP